MGVYGNTQSPNDRKETKTMMMSEFEALTGIHPTDDLYAEIEEAYYEFDGQKREFCAAYKANIDGLADTIRDRAHEAAVV